MAEDKNLRERLIEAMAEMANPKKSETATVPTKSGRQYTYKYETLDQVLAVVRPALMRHGIGLAQESRWDGDGQRWLLVTSVFDAREQMTLDMRELRTYPSAQDTGSWETYMRRYALRTAFGLAGEDDDGARTARAKPQEPSEKERFWRVCQQIASARPDTTAEEVSQEFRKFLPSKPSDADWAEARVAAQEQLHAINNPEISS